MLRDSWARVTERTTLTKTWLEVYSTVPLNQSERGEGSEDFRQACLVHKEMQA